jgi:hypothetical protein
LGFAGRAGRVLQKEVLQGSVMGGKGVGGAPPRETAQTLQAAVGELVEIALDAAPRDSGQTGDVVVRESLTFEPQDLHLLLDARMGMVIAIMANGGEDVGSESECSHGKLLPNPCSCITAAL